MTSLANQVNSITWMKVVCMPIDPKSPKVVVEHGSQSVAIGSGNKSQVTIVGCVSAAGFCMPPMVIWDRKTLAPELTVGEVPGQSMGFPVMGGWTKSHLTSGFPQICSLC